MKLGKLYAVISNQAGGAPFMDSATTVTREVVSKREVWRGRGKSFLLTPWRRNKYGESLPQKALTIGITV